MAPSAEVSGATSDHSGQFIAQHGTNQRILLLSPPSLSSHPQALSTILASHDRSTTDMQMLDRVSLGLANLPPATYDQVVLLNDPDGTKAEVTNSIGRELLEKVVKAMKAGGRLRRQDGAFASDMASNEYREAVLAGLVFDRESGLIKPEEEAIKSVPLRLSKKSPGTAPVGTSTVTTNGSTVSEPVNGKRKADASEASQPAGVGFVDSSHDLDAPPDVEEDDDDDLIDENTLLDEDDLARPVIQPLECRPKAGKRRRACKDCTCGLREKLEAEDATKRKNADQALSTMKLAADDLAEVDFTVQGKVGSCGNCALGDAFRCDGCPYIGLPAFKPGEEVRLLNDDVQL